MANIFEFKAIKYDGIRQMQSGDKFVNKTNATITISKIELVDDKEKYTPLQKLEPNAEYVATEDITIAVQTIKSNPKYTIETVIAS